MKKQVQAFPKTLIQAIRHFSNPDTCIEFLVALRWPDGVVCPTCGSKEVSYISTRRIWKCKVKHDHRQFSIKVGTIMEDSPIGLDKWLAAMWMISGAKNGISSYEIHRALGITQKSAWFLMHRIRKAMQNGSLLKLGGNSGEVEVDESFIGGKARNMHASRRRKLMQNQRGPINKTIVFGMKERGGQVVTHVISERTKETLHPLIKQHVDAGSALYSDEWTAYDGLKEEYGHEVINHAEKYVRGKVHTNGMENYWSLLKRCLNGTYVSVEPFHLFRYLDEQSFRYNNRATKDNDLNDADRFTAVAAQIVGRRVTYKELTGKNQEGETAPF